MADPVRQIVERIARDGSHELSREIARQTIEVFDHRDRLLAALARYGNHWANCKWHETPLIGVDCSCGLRAAIRGDDV